MNNGLFDFDVSRETLERLEGYVQELMLWNKRINLISAADVKDVYRRHIQDSAQLLTVLDHKVETWLDLGSGGGLPGLVVAIVGPDMGLIRRVILVESDKRKSVFLSEVVRKLNLPVEVKNQRIESLTKQGADVVSARALAALPRLLSFANHHLAPQGVAIFPKGKTCEDEIVESRKKWNFQLTRIQSKTEEHATILKIKEITPCF